MEGKIENRRLHMSSRFMAKCQKMWENIIWLMKNFGLIIFPYKKKYKLAPLWYHTKVNFRYYTDLNRKDNNTKFLEKNSSYLHDYE